MGTGGFGARLGAFLAVTVFVAALAAVTVWTREQARRLDEAVASQVNFVLSEAKAALETQLNLGLPLADLPRVDDQLGTARAALPAIRSVAVLDEAGTVLFSTSTVEVGERVPVPPGEPGLVWSAAHEGERVYGIGLTTSFDTVAGTILLRLPPGAMAEPVRRYALGLGIGALLIAAPVGLLAWLAGLRLASGPRRDLSALADALEELDDSRPAPARAPVRPAADPFGLPLSAFAATVRHRLGLLDAAERDVSRLDELA
ncbi:hypothetical protein J2847_003682 [Azospirillum agricola]|uniref:hypothetical protein n=1 Tax=Azospirillum agricola TaxID=1720247 RepID=UPI001AE7929B|nr:hypothetical protein [Azospirillum agricola]MBP2230379.1 hypothetical protein [Azospirillum agricola]